MYKLKPIYEFSDGIDLPGSIYKMKNISQYVNGDIPSPSVLEQVNNMLKKPSLEVEDLKKRQEGLLKQLTYLKEQMVILRNELNKKNLTNAISSKNEDKKLLHQDTQVKPSWSGVGEIVVQASVEQPPYSLLAVNQLWPSALQLRVTCHSHSTVVDLPSHLNAFSSLAQTPNANLNIRLIWKQMESDCSTVISPLNHCLLRGEVNLLRYLHRTVTSSPSDPAAEVKLDGILDVCHRLSHARTLKEKQSLVRALNARLGKSMWLNGDSMSVADLAAWSCLRSVSGVDLTQNLIKWQSRCSAAAGVGLSATLLPSSDQQHQTPPNTPTVGVRSDDGNIVAERPHQN